jgi:hypothetical protein
MTYSKVSWWHWCKSVPPDSHFAWRPICAALLKIKIFLKICTYKQKCQNANVSKILSFVNLILQQQYNKDNLGIPCFQFSHWSNIFQHVVTLWYKILGRKYFKDDIPGMGSILNFLGITLCPFCFRIIGKLNIISLKQS